MKIYYKNIVLRDMKESDINDEIRWNTVETDWAHWDAPWESEPDLLTFDPEKHREKELIKLSKPLEKLRRGFEIDTAEGTHIGSLNSYMINGEFEWTPINKAKPGEKLLRTIGIDICESSFCEKCFGTNALAAFIDYYLKNGETELYCQTWSGNIRMIRLAEKLGFEVCRRRIDFRHVHGKDYDGLTFRLNNEKFNELFKKDLSGTVTLRETEKDDLTDLKALWADGDVMKFVGFPDGLKQTDKEMAEWYGWICSKRPVLNHYSVFEGSSYCGETFYKIDGNHGNSAALDIKLFKFARGRGIASKVLSYAVEEAFENGAEKVWVDPNPDNKKAMALYERLGFVKRKMPDYLVEDGGEGAVYMELCKMNE